jgi:DNA-binding GntR family transcriptional regulator
MAKRAGVESLAVDVFEQLRADIFHKILAPGGRLKPVELSVRLGVSTGVVREALSLLAAQNLVRIERNRGYHVMELSADALAELVGARKITEGAALRLSVTLGGVAWESELLAAHHRLTREPVSVPGEPNAYNINWGLAHSAFHYKLIEACGNRVLLDICTRLSDAAEVYRAWALPRNGEVMRDVASEHEELMNAALAHDAELAVALFDRHIERTREGLFEQEFGCLRESAS